MALSQPSDSADKCLLGMTLDSGAVRVWKLGSDLDKVYENNLEAGVVTHTKHLELCGGSGKVTQAIFSFPLFLCPNLKFSSHSKMPQFRAVFSSSKSRNAYNYILTVDLLFPGPTRKPPALAPFCSTLPTSSSPGMSWATSSSWTRESTRSAPFSLPRNPSWP